MAIQFKASSKSADAPEIDDGVYPALFKGISEKVLDKSQYGNGEVWIWRGEVNDGGDLIDLEMMTSRSLNITSKTTPKAVKNLKGLLTKPEWAGFLEGEGFDAADLLDRPCQVEVIHNDNGWPQIAAFMPKVAKRKPAADDD